MDPKTYLPVYIEETRENIQLMSENLLLLERHPDNLDAINTVFRAIHTIKGMSATMGYSEISQIAHEAENYLDWVRDGKAVVDDQVINALFELADEIEDQLEALASKGEPKETDSRRMAVLSRFRQDETVEDEESKPALYSIRVTLDPDCMLKVARMLTIYKQISIYGEVQKITPTVAEMVETQAVDMLECTMVTDKSHAIRHFLTTHGDVAQFSIDRVGDAPVAKDVDGEREYAATEEDMVPQPVFPTFDKTEQKQDSHSQTTESPAGRHSGSIRIDTDKLDRLLNLVSELVINKTSIQQQASEVPEMSDGVEHLNRLTADLQETVMQMRMIPLETVFNRFPRMVRDAARSLNKSVTLEVAGAETELDRTIIDDIADPLVHLLRNAVDHGIESAELREQAGKPAAGTIKIQAYQTGNRVVIEVADDGGGIDIEAVKRQAVARGLIAADEHDQNEILNCIFSTGVSTTGQVTDLSGRGVGLDVVKSSIENLGGLVEVSSTRGKGTVFRISLPLTLAIIQGMLVQSAHDIFVVPVSYILETEIIYPEEIKMVGQQRIYMLRGKVLPIVSLAELMGVNDYQPPEEMSMVVAQHGDRQVGILVDDLIAQQEVVIKNVAWGQELFQNFIGTTILGDGSVVLIIDVNNLLAPLKIKEGGKLGQSIRSLPAGR